MVPVRTLFCIAGLLSAAGCSDGDKPAQPRAQTASETPRAPASVPITKSAPTPTASARAASAEDAQARIERWFAEGGALDDRTVADLFKAEPYRVDMFNDDGEGHVAGSYWVQRIWIDLDRDGKWDEKWSRKLTPKGPGSVETLREIAPSDDESYTRKLVDRDDGTGWVPVL